MRYGAAENGSYLKYIEKHNLELYIIAKTATAELFNITKKGKI